MNMFCVFGFVAHVKIAADAVNGAGFGFSDLFGMYGLRIGYYVTFVGMVLITILVNKKRKVY